jgi:hypothetical protein
MEGYETGLLAGDTEYAVSCLWTYSVTTFCCGENLNSLDENVLTFIKRAIHYRQKVQTKFLLPLLQLILDLKGSAEVQPYSEFNDGSTEESFVANAIGNRELSSCRFYFITRKFKAFWLEDMDAMSECYEKCLEYSVGENARSIPVIYSTFLDGLIAFYFARKQRADESKWTRIGEDVIETMKHWAKTSSWNFENKLLLVEAEYYFHNGNREKAIECYLASAKAAKDHRFIHEQGLAYEKLATFLLHEGEKHNALGYFNMSKQCYDRWGAKALVYRIEQITTMLSPKDDRGT